jgi:hypothetical protein
MNNNQYGFTPQRGTIDAAIAVKDFVGKGLAAGEVMVLVSLDVRGAFDAVWWPSILNGLKACGCPKIYITYPTATLANEPLSCQPTALEWKKK